MGTQKWERQDFLPRILEIFLVERATGYRLLPPTVIQISLSIPVILGNEVLRLNIYS